MKEWQRRRSQYKNKTEFDHNFIGECRLKYEDIEISERTLYRKWTAYKNNDIEGLLDSRGGWNRGKSTIPEPVWNAFLWYWLDDNRPTVSLCYRSSIKWTTEFYPEFLENFPSERAFRRQIDRDVSYALKTMRSTRPQQIKRNGVYVKIADEPVWFMHEEQTINNLEKWH